MGNVLNTLSACLFLSNYATSRIFSNGELKCIITEVVLNLVNIREF